MTLAAITLESRREIAGVIRAVAGGSGNIKLAIDAFDGGMRWVRNQAIPECLMKPLESLRGFLDHPYIVEFLKTDDALAQVRQTLNEPGLKAAYRGTTREKRKFSAQEIPAVTQLFTPRWVVEFLLEKTLGRLWGQMHRAEESPSVKTIRVCDPACGTMNFGIVAIDLLRKMYAEEIRRAGQVGWPAEPPCRVEQIDEFILKHNLFGIDIDPMAIDLARRTLEIKTGRTLAAKDVNLQTGDALVSRRDKFDIIVTNPPYLAARNMDEKTVARLKRDFPTAWRDAYACFIVAALEMLNDGGRAGILCMHSFMFTAVFEKLRGQICETAAIEDIAHFGPGLFKVGNPGTLQTAAIVLRREADAGIRARQKIEIARLVDAEDKYGAMVSGDRANIYTPVQSEFSQIPRGAWIYWLSPGLRRAFVNLPALGKVAPPRQGLATTDNARFVRYWWEVEPPGFKGPRPKWLPYAKAGRFRRWYEASRHRVNWEDDGREIKQNIIERYPYLNGKWQWVAKNSAYYGRGGITYSYLTSGQFSARQLEVGALFDVAGSSLFPEDPLTMLGILNSSTAGKLLGAISPTVNFQVGDLCQLPVPTKSSQALRDDVQRAIDLTRQMDGHDETCPDFAEPEPWEGEVDIRRELREVQARINRDVAGLYGVDEEIDPGLQTEFEIPRIELARRWVSYALLSWLGRWGEGSGELIARLRPLDLELEKNLREFIARRAGTKAAREIEAAVGTLGDFLGREFPAWHNRMYRYRPVVWTFAVGKSVMAMRYDVANARVLSEAGIAAPGDWKLQVDLGIARNLAPLAGMMADRQMQKVLRG